MRIRKSFLLGLLSIILILLIVTWFMVTQPLFSMNRSRSTAEVDPASLKSHVSMLAEKFVPRDYKHPENLDRAAAYIRREFDRTNGRVSEQTYEVNGHIYRNVILQLGPHTEERIVVGAHYDTAGPLPGADDNASGIAGLIELAYLLDRVSLPLTVELIAYTLEEPPFFRTSKMGSAVHANNLKKQGVLVRMMISMEMIGTFSDDANSQLFPFPFLKLFYPSEGNWIGVIGNLSSGSDVRRVKASMHRATELPVYSFNAPPLLVPGIDWSDHLNYWNYGYPAVMITDTSFFRNINYHSEHDTPEKLDYERMSMVVVGVYEAVLDIAQE